MVEEDDLLLKRMGQGDTAAFEALFVRYYDRVYRVVYNLMGSREAVEDLLQETFLSLYRQPPALNADVPLVAWLCRVGLNRAYNLLRTESREQHRAEQLMALSPHHDPQAEALRAEERMEVRAALARLSERQTKLLLLRHAGLSYAEIAAALEVAPGSVGTLLVRAEKAFMLAYESTESIERDDALKPRTP